MNTESIITTLLSAAAFLKKPIQDAATHSIKDLFDATRYYIKRKFRERTDATMVLDLATEKPDSVMRKAVLIEEAEAARLASDSELTRLIEQMAALLPQTADQHSQHVRVSGRANKVLVAGRDVITTERLVQRSAITPDERHLTVEQRRQLREVLSELATRLAGDDGRPNFAAVHRILQRRFQVLSYSLIPRERFNDALSFLKQQRAIHRSRLRVRNPVAYQTDLFRAVFASAGELGWERTRVFEFAQEKLALKKPLMSLKELGANQLKSLAESIRRKVGTAREVANDASVPVGPKTRQENS